jgi:hypothetical protein
MDDQILFGLSIGSKQQLSQFVSSSKHQLPQFVSSSTLKLWAVPLVFVSLVWVSDLPVSNFAETTVLWREWFAGTRVLQVTLAYHLTR